MTACRKIPGPRSAWLQASGSCSASCSGASELARQAQRQELPRAIALHEEGHRGAFARGAERTAEALGAGNRLPVHRKNDVAALKSCLPSDRARHLDHQAGVDAQALALLGAQRRDLQAGEVAL